MAKKIASFECTVCCDIYVENTRNKKIECTCGCIVCNHCQKEYGKAQCMNCKLDISKETIENLLGKTFVKSVIEKRKIDELIQEEKEFIAATDELIQFYEREKEDRALLRKGLSKIASSADRVRPVIRGRIYSELCTMPECNGILKLNMETKKYECIICKKEHCVDCVCVKESNGSPHICDKAVLETLKSLNEETKKCPKCYTRIYKTHGCDHMNCTNCNTHFSWNTGIISNYGYNPNQPFRREEAGVAITNVYVDRIPQSVMIDYKLPPKLMKILYDETEGIRRYFKDECNYNTILNKYYMANDDLRIKYMRSELNEAQWGRHLYTNYKSMKLKINYREVIEHFLSGINRIQSTAYHQLKSGGIHAEEEICQSVIDLMRTCNASFEKINDEFYCEHTITKYQFNIPTYDTFSEEDYLILSKSSSSSSEKKVIKRRTPKKKSVGDGENIDQQMEAILQDANGIEEEKTKAEKKKEITLFEYQHPHFEKIFSILDQHNIALDLSPLGTGKTYISAKYIEINPQLKHVYIICPASLRSKWSDVVKTHGLPNVEIYSYNEVAGHKMVNPKHGLLHRNDFKTSRLIMGNNVEIEMASFKISDKYRKYYEDGELLFIFDEIQHIRNENSYTTNACRELMRHILNNKMGNKMICISGTPFDKSEQIITFYRNVGIQTSDELVSHNWHTGEYSYKGYQNIIDYCQKIDVNGAGKVFYDEVKRNKHLHAEACKYKGYQLFLCVILKYLSSHMKMIEKNKHTIFNINTFHTLSPESNKVCMAAMDRILSLMAADGTITDHEKRVDIFKALPILEASKLEVFEQEVCFRLETLNHAKVVCALNYTDNIDDLMNRLAQYNPQRLDGSVNTEKRAQIIRKFQEPNDECKLLICNTSVISAGIDLDDKDGRYPRHVFVSPTYKIIDMNQLSFRFLRSLDTKSDTTIRYIYTIHCVDPKIRDEAKKVNETHHYKEVDIPVQNKAIHQGTEMRILYHLSKKATVMKSISKEEVEFPCDFKCKVVF